MRKMIREKENIGEGMHIDIYVGEDPNNTGVEGEEADDERGKGVKTYLL